MNSAGPARCWPIAQGGEEDDEYNKHGKRLSVQRSSSGSTMDLPTSCTPRDGASQESRVGAVNYPFANLILYINYN